MIKNCKKCGTEFNAYSKWGEKSFCSRTCANSRVFSDEARHKKSIALKGKTNNLSPENLEKRIEKYKKTVKARLLTVAFESLGQDRKRLRVFAEQNSCCAKCGLSEWLGQKIVLELEHKDGNNTNNVRENLEGLCPNCHSLTDTWRGRNKGIKNNNNYVSDKILLECLTQSKNIHQGLLKAGMAAKGKNYKRAKKLLEKNSI